VSLPNGGRGLHGSACAPWRRLSASPDPNRLWPPVLPPPVTGQHKTPVGRKTLRLIGRLCLARAFRPIERTGRLRLPRSMGSQVVCTRRRPVRTPPAARESPRLRSLCRGRARDIKAEGTSPPPPVTDTALHAAQAIPVLWRDGRGDVSVLQAIPPHRVETMFRSLEMGPASVPHPPCRPHLATISHGVSVVGRGGL